MNNFIIIIFFLISFDLKANCNSVGKINQSNFKYQSSELTRWYLSPNKEIKGIAMAFHGLNAKPSMMVPLIKFLNSNGIHVLRGSLRGHRGSLNEMEQVKLPDWQADVLEIYCLARKRADKLDLPLFYIGHSLGGLLFNDLAAKEKVKIDKAILFAPAFKIHWHLNFFSFIFNIKDSWSLPSRNLPQYRSQDVCTFAAYKALMDAIDEFKPQDYIPTLILMDPGDELVDYDAILELRVKNWQLVEVDTSKTTHSKIYHHLAFNEACFGTKEWKRIQKIMEDFLWTRIGMK